MYDADIMEIILRDTRFAAKTLRNLSAYKKNRLHANQVEVVYHYGKGMEKLNMGRLFPHSNLGLQSFPHDIRNPLLEKYYWDVDMENAHFVFMVKKAEEYGLRNDALKFYVNNRDDCLKRVSQNRRTAKTAYLKTGYGGNVKLYSEFYNDDATAPEGDISQVKECEAEIIPLINAIWNDPKYKEAKKLAVIKNGLSYKEGDVKKKANPVYSLFAFVLQTEECKCLRLIDAYLKTKDRHMDVYIHDGGEVRKLPNETEFPPSLLRGAEEVVLKDTGHKIKLVVKKMEHKFTPPSTDGSILIDDDYDACIEIKKKYPNRIVRAADDWYVNMPETNHWDKGEEFVKNLILTANLRRPTEHGSVAYGANATGCNNIFKALCSAHTLYPRNDNFIDEINRDTEGKVYFQDKYWDLAKKKWFPIGIEEKPIIPLIYIKRNAPTFENITKEEIDEVRNNCLNMYATEEDQNLYLRATARGLGGHIKDKTFYALRGERDSGKGVIQEISQLSFGEYICIFDIPMMKSGNTGDASELRWVLALNAHLKRIGFSNETKNIEGKIELPVDGNIMKKVIASGGDSFLARNHYKGECMVKNNLTSFLCLNKIPKCNPPDGLDKMLPFDMPYKFVEASDLALDSVSYRLGNPDIKTIIKANGGEGKRWSEIYLWLVFENYTTNKIVKTDMSVRNQEELQNVKKASDAVNAVKLFTNAFVEMEKGWVSAEDIKKVLAPANLSDPKFGTFLKDRGFKKLGKEFVSKDMNGNPLLGEDGKPIKKRIHGYTGLAKREKNEDDEDDEHSSQEPDELDC